MTVKNVFSLISLARPVFVWFSEKRNMFYRQVYRVTKTRFRIGNDQLLFDDFVNIAYVNGQSFAVVVSEIP